MSKLVKDSLKTAYNSYFNDAEHCVVVDIQKLPSSEAASLRNELREKNIQMKVVLNRLARKTLAGTKIEAAQSLLTGMSAVVYGGEDAVTVAKTIVAWRKERKNKLLPIRGGCIDGQVMDSKGVESVSKLPGKLELRGMVVQCIASPLKKIMGVVQGPSRAFMYAMNARKEQLDEQS